LESFNRVNALGNKFWHRFYDNFLESDDKIPAFFAHTDVINQIKMMSQSVAHIMLYSSSEANSTSSVIEGLVHKHKVELKIPNGLYAKWGESFLITLEELDPEFDENLKTQWREAIQGFLKPFYA
jgi:hemoglobin-like flavoprotein